MKTTILQFIFLFIAISIATLYLNTQKVKTKEIEIKGTEKVTLKFDNENLSLILDNNDTVKDLLKILPIEGKTKNLNGNELYIMLNKQIKSNPIKVKKIHKGDVMLYNDNCLVIFYEDFETEYEYTKLGKVLLTNKLDDIKDQDNIKVTINNK